ncbi:uncharacterized protein HMPREF1541_09466 [Cyphellophora europaea CBS 101466]|uniref:RBR-type E3 ubiquitin transferase n=1 Tax=Cyphellophora europaea (strain CBS 101466) TaxID=1220924 RepID=W2SCH5_CYPE1|nr:uncharacterized protein HMPREF1541_09466 [Cyphellophora europaea CBS 101466]ETN45634.1 hypothetical protein HMPREF1541_09466 [Cyphellophora europaea CBS 101466]
MSCINRLFTFRRRTRQLGEEQAGTVTSDSHASPTTEAALTSQRTNQASTSTSARHAGRTFLFTNPLNLNLNFLTNRFSKSTSLGPPLLDDLHAAGLTFDTMTLADDEEASSLPRKRLKRSPFQGKTLTCDFCTDAIENEEYLRPCRHCKSTLCYNCVEHTFTIALSDHERMPARCCDRVLYPGVATGVLEPAELQRYKERYDETNTPNPYYCPVQTCSAFIPPRMLDVKDGHVTCPLCATQSCFRCRQVADEGHTCERKEEKAIVETYNYKLCPKCGTGLMRMYGCAHVRCQCGAHWCWDCRRPMQACYRKPCDHAREDGDATQESDVPDEVSDDEEEVQDGEVSAESQQQTQQNGTADEHVSDDNALNNSAPFAGSSDLPTVSGNGPESTQHTSIGNPEEPAPLSSSHHDTPTADPDSSPVTEESLAGPRPAGDTTAQSATEVLTDEAGPAPSTAQDSAQAPEESTSNTVTNLDDPDPEDWEARSLDFGDEPVDESFDVWGCQHKFRVFNIESVPDHWVKNLDRQKGLAVECMCCFKTVHLPGPQTVVKDNKMGDSHAKGRKGRLNRRRGRSPTPSATLTLARQDASIEDLAKTGAAGKDDVKTEVEKDKLAGLAMDEKELQELQKAEVRRKRTLLAYVCWDCGVLYCWGCRRDALRRIGRERAMEV